MKDRILTASNPGSFRGRHGQIKQKIVGGVTQILVCHFLVVSRFLLNITHLQLHSKLEVNDSLHAGYLPVCILFFFSNISSAISTHTVQFQTPSQRRLPLILLLSDHQQLFLMSSASAPTKSELNEKSELVFLNTCIIFFYYMEILKEKSASKTPLTKAKNHTTIIPFLKWF